MGQRLQQCLRNPQTETDFFVDSGHVTGHAWCSVLTVSALLKENVSFITLYHIMPVAKVQPSSRAAGTANWEFVCKIDLELDFRNGKECFMTVK